MSDEDDQMDLFDGAGAAEPGEPAGDGEAGERVAVERPAARLLEETGRDLLAYADRVAGAMSEETDLEEPTAHLAAELVGMVGGLDADQARNLFVIVLVSLDHLQSGNTRMPLDWSEAGPIARRLRPLRGFEELGAEVPTIEALGENFEAIVEQGLADEILGEPGDYTPLVVAGGGEHLYHQRMFHYETRLVEAVRGRLAGTVERWGGADAEEVEAALRAVVEEEPLRADGGSIRLNAEQQYALLTACHCPLTVVTGGPGTGKTSLVVDLLRVAVRLGVPADAIALAAPTGKAATRLREAVDEHLSAMPELADDDRRLEQTPLEAKTLHRLLGFSPETERFHHHEHNPLSADLVVVDEASMIDLFLMDRLLAAMPDETPLVLLGDADQLPSVESGAVFRDLVPERCATDTSWRELAVDPLEARASEEPTARCSVRLETSYRMSPDRPRGRQILQVARRINEGTLGDSGADDTAAGASPVGDERDSLPFETRSSFDDLGTDREVGVEHVPFAPDGTDGDLADFVDYWYDHQLADHPDLPTLLRRDYRFDGRRFTDDAADALETLVRHVGAARVLTLTRVLERGSERLNAMFHRTHVRRRDLRRRAEFVPGDPVIVTRNDYEHMLFNGEQGVVVRVDRGAGQPAEAMAVFEQRGTYRPFPLAELAHHLELAYALTVHKAQGSEYDRVAVTLPDEPNSLLTRELLYTATTRARRRVVFAGPAEMLVRGARTAVARHSGVADGLDRSADHVDNPDISE